MPTPHSPFLIVGPTASGKTSLSIRLAEKFSSHIWSLDSRQCYKHLRIGTAAPTVAELDRVPHHNIGVLEPDQKESAAFFIERLKARFPNWKTPNAETPSLLFVGGSTLHAQALLFQLDDIPSANEENLASLQQKLDHEGEHALLDLLKKADPEYAARMEGFNRQRCFRALDVWMQTDKPFSSFHTQSFETNESGVPVYGLQPKREQLYEHINKRVDQMWSDGIVEECQAVLNMGFPASSHALEGVGYREIVQMLAGEITPNEAKEQMKTRTRRYAKRQLTWFKRWKFIHWYEDPNIAYTKIASLVEAQLNK